MPDEQPAREHRKGQDDELPIMIQVRLPRALVRLVDHFAIDHDLYRAQAVALLLTEGLKAMGVEA